MPHDRAHRRRQRARPVYSNPHDVRPAVIRQRMPADAGFGKVPLCHGRIRCRQQMRRTLERDQTRSITASRERSEVGNALRLTERLAQRPVRDVQAGAFVQTTLSRSVGIAGTGPSGKSGRVLPNSVSESSSVNRRSTFAGDPAAIVKGVVIEPDTTEPSPTMVQSAIETPGAIRTSDPM